MQNSKRMVPLVWRGVIHGFRCVDRLGNRHNQKMDHHDFRFAIRGQCIKGKNLDCFEHNHVFCFKLHCASIVVLLCTAIWWQIESCGGPLFARNQSLSIFYMIGLWQQPARHNCPKMTFYIPFEQTWSSRNLNFSFSQNFNLSPHQCDQIWRNFATLAKL